ncbi:MAG: GTP-binding protein [Methylococcales bacterium]|nr:GTP-binding protein [Methylococcales bacterium]
MRPTATSLNRIPVFLLTGFLGSGKTTLLNRLLAHSPKSAVIINEFGAMPIDQQLLREHKAPLSVLVGGCLCCQVKGSLSPMLKNLRMGWESGTIAFDRVIIETSGVANPEPVMDSLLRERWLAARFSLQAVICTVSAVMDAANFETFPEVKAQIAWADTVVLTQTDLATSGQIEEASNFLAHFAPAAKRLTAVNGDVDMDAILGLALTLRPMIQSHAFGLAEHSFSSVGVQLATPIIWEVLQSALLSTMAEYQSSLLRIKGLVYVSGQDTPVLVQATADRLYPPTLLPLRPTDDGVGRLVFISRGELVHLTDNFLAKLRCGT